MDRILAGKAEETIKDRARNAKFDERLPLLGLLLDAVTIHLRDVCDAESAQTKLLEALKAVRVELAKPGADVAGLLEGQIKLQREALAAGRRASSMNREEQAARESLCGILEEQRTLLLKERPRDGKAAFLLLKGDFDQRTAALQKSAAGAGKKLTNLFHFCGEVFPDGQALLILVTELTLNPHCARFIGRYGCKEYYQRNKELLFYERQREIIQKMEELDWSLD